MQFQAETFEEMAELSKTHGLEMAMQGDESHFKAMNTMQELMSTPQAMKEWLKDKRKEFDALPEEEE
jgi:hypothetical protein